MTWKKKTKIFGILAFISLCVIARYYQKKEASVPMPGWSQLVTWANPFMNDDTVVLITPNYALNWPKTAAKVHKYSLAFDKTEVMYGRAPQQLEESLRRGLDVLDIYHRGRRDDRLEVARNELYEKYGYKTVIFHVHVIEAAFRTRNPAKIKMYETHQLNNSSEESIINWAVDKANNQESKSVKDDPLELKHAIAGYVSPQGLVRQSRAFMLDPLRGLNRFQLGNEDWEYVGRLLLTARNKQKEIIYFHPPTEGKALLTVPDVKLGKRIKVEYGLEDGNIISGGQPVQIDVFAGEAVLGRIVMLNQAGWQEAEINTESFDRQRLPLTFIGETPNNQARHIGFMPVIDKERVKLSKRVTLTKQNRLSDFVKEMSVFRKGDYKDEAVEALSYVTNYMTAEAMHEKEGPSLEGGLKERWLLGTREYEAVGKTWQRSAGELQQGVWAHPKSGKEIIIEVKRLQTKGLLRGCYGFTDHAMDYAERRKIEGNVKFEIYRNGWKALERNAERIRGWTYFTLTEEEWAQPGAPDLKIRITSDNDSWAHFIFDLWGDESLS